MNKLLPGRLKKFKLEVATEKTRLIRFGRFVKENSKNGKVETFDFLGFTHYCGKGRNGNFRVKRKTSRKKFKAKVKEIKQWIKDNREIRATKNDRIIKYKTKRILSILWNNG